MMKISRRKTVLQKLQFNNLSLLFITTLFFSGCSFYYQDVEYKRAKKAVQKADFNKALFHYTRVIKKSPDKEQSLVAANEAAKIALFNLKDFYSAINYFEFLVLYSKNTKDRLQAQEQIAFIYYERLNDYGNSIKEYSKLLALPIEKNKKADFHFKVAKAYYYLNKFQQSVLELEMLLKQELPMEQHFSVRLFKANVLLTNKDFDKAIEEYEYLLNQFPELSSKENLELVIAVAYEDKNDFDKAIKTLEELKSKAEDPEFIEIKIKRLRDRISNQPQEKRKI